MFSKSTEYALRATIYIARKSSDGKISGLKEISDAIDSPISFTAKILQSLTSNNKIVSSVRGPKGGFFLTKNAGQLPVRSILEVMGEDKILEKCVLGLRQCSETTPCPMHHQYKSIKLQLISLFETKTIEELVKDMKEGDLFIGNEERE